jgi:hypothetical protein
VIPVVAQALLKPGFDPAIFLLPAQNKALTTIFAKDFHFYTQKKTPPTLYFLG